MTFSGRSKLRQTYLGNSFNPDLKFDFPPNADVTELQALSSWAAFTAVCSVLSHVAMFYESLAENQHLLLFSEKMRYSEPLVSLRHSLNNH